MMPWEKYQSSEADAQETQQEGPWNKYSQPLTSHSVSMGDFVLGDASASDYGKSIVEGVKGAAKSIVDPESWKNLGKELTSFPEDDIAKLREEPTTNTDLSGLAMTAMPITAMSGAARDLVKRVNTQGSKNRLVGVASREGIPLTGSQMTGSKPSAIAESVLENLPSTSTKQLALRDTQKKAFNSAVLRKAGIDGSEATPEVLAANKVRLGKVFNDVSSRNSIDLNKVVVDDLANISKESSRRLAKPGPIINTIDDIISDASKTGVLSGEKYQGWREVLGRMSKGGDTEAHYAGQIKKSLDRAFSKQISGADAEAWKTASKQYGNLKVILETMGGSGSEQLLGNIPASQLSLALTRQVGKEGKALGRGDLNELAKVGKSFISEKLPDSGTAQRLFYQKLMTGNLVGAVPGAAVGYYEGGVPGAVAGGFLGAGIAYGSPKLAQIMMNPGTFPAKNETLTKLLLKRLSAGTAAGQNSLAAIPNEQRNRSSSNALKR